LLSAYHPGDYTPPKRQIAVDDVAGKEPRPVRGFAPDRVSRRL
jgi:hypothetical protein